jgi:hypothetical protein
MAHIEKLRKGGAQVFDGRRFVNRRNNQTKVSSEAGEGALVMRRDRGGTRWEDFFLSFGAANRATKIQKEGYGISFKRPPLAETTQQPTENSTRWGGVKDSAAEERLGRTITRCLDGDSSDEK